MFSSNPDPAIGKYFVDD